MLLLMKMRRILSNIPDKREHYMCSCKCKESEQRRFISACATRSGDRRTSLSRSCFSGGVDDVRWVCAGPSADLACTNREDDSTAGLCNFVGERNEWNVKQVEDGITERHPVKAGQVFVAYNIWDRIFLCTSSRSRSVTCSSRACLVLQREVVSSTCLTAYSQIVYMEALHSQPRKQRIEDGNAYARFMH